MVLQDPSGTMYVTSAAHVFTSSPNGPLQPGASIVQAGVGDTLAPKSICEQNTSNILATLSAIVPYTSGPSATNTVDAAMAEILPGTRSFNGDIFGIAQYSSTIMSPAVDMDVEKIGRTTAFTQSTITDINGMVTFQYETKFGDKSSEQPIHFIHQIVASPAFTAAGDSGALVLTAGTSCPLLIGTVSGGDSEHTYINPLHDVIKQLAAAQNVKRLAIFGASCTPSEADIAKNGLAQLKTNNAEGVRQRHLQELMAIPHVDNVATHFANGQMSFLLQTRDPDQVLAIKALAPKQVEGYPILVERVPLAQFQ
jgi:hypothetical protein